MIYDWFLLICFSYYIALWSANSWSYCTKNEKLVVNSPRAVVRPFAQDIIVYFFYLDLLDFCKILFC